MQRGQCVQHIWAAIMQHINISRVAAIIFVAKYLRYQKAHSAVIFRSFGIDQKRSLFLQMIIHCPRMKLLV